jgi:hypothetical protein
MHCVWYRCRRATRASAPSSDPPSSTTRLTPTLLHTPLSLPVSPQSMLSGVHGACCAAGLQPLRHRRSLVPLCAPPHRLTQSTTCHPGPPASSIHNSRRSRSRKRPFHRPPSSSYLHSGRARDTSHSAPSSHRIPVSDQRLRYRALHRACAAAGAGAVWTSSHLLFTPPLSTPLHRCRRSPRPLLVAAHTRLVRLRRLDYRDARFHGRRTDHRPRGGGHDFPLCARSPPITLRARVSSRTRLLSHTSLPRTSLTPAPASLLAHEPPAPASLLAHEPPAPASFLAYGRPTHAVVQSTPHIQCHAAAGTSCVCVRAYCRCATSL